VLLPVRPLENEIHTERILKERALPETVGDIHLWVRLGIDGHPHGMVFHLSRHPLDELPMRAIESFGNAQDAG